MNEVGELNEGGAGMSGSGATGSGATGGNESGATGSGATGGSGSGGTSATDSGGTAGTQTGGSGTSGSMNSAEGGAGVAEPVYAKDPQNCGEEECPGPTECAPAAGWASSTATSGVLDFEPVEVWRGYIVNPFPPLLRDDDKVTLYVKERTATSITGAVVFGEGEVPAPATDPAIGYIPTEIYGSTDWVPPGSYDNLRVPEPWPGFALSMLGGAVTGSRLEFSAHSTEQWRGWCEMVLGVPVPGEVDRFSCTPGGGSSGYVCNDPEPACQQCLSGGGSDPSSYVEYDCRKYRLCSAQVCQCEGECCTASQIEGRFAFDLRLENGGTELNGSIIEGFGGSTDWDVHLTLDD